jgi:hypothetical protein
MTDEILHADLDAQRTAAHRVKRSSRLIDERGMADVSYQVVRACIAARKPEIRTEAGRGPAEVFIRRPTGPGWRPRSTSVRSRSGSGARW